MITRAILLTAVIVSCSSKLLHQYEAKSNNLALQTADTNATVLPVDPEEVITMKSSVISPTVVEPTIQQQALVEHDLSKVVQTLDVIEKVKQNLNAYLSTHQTLPQNSTTIQPAAVEETISSMTIEGVEVENALMEEKLELALGYVNSNIGKLVNAINPPLWSSLVKEFKVAGVAFPLAAVFLDIFSPPVAGDPISQLFTQIDTALDAQYQQALLNLGTISPIVYGSEMAASLPVLKALSEVALASNTFYNPFLYESVCGENLEECQDKLLVIQQNLPEYLSSVIEDSVVAVVNQDETLSIKGYSENVNKAVNVYLNTLFTGYKNLIWAITANIRYIELHDCTADEIAATVCDCLFPGWSSCCCCNDTWWEDGTGSTTTCLLPYAAKIALNLINNHMTTTLTQYQEQLWKITETRISVSDFETDDHNMFLPGGNLLKGMHKSSGQLQRVVSGRSWPLSSYLVPMQYMDWTNNTGQLNAAFNCNDGYFLDISHVSQTQLVVIVLLQLLQLQHQHAILKTSQVFGLPRAIIGRLAHSLDTMWLDSITVKLEHILAGQTILFH